jgi:uncharacterized membrane protein
MDTSAGVKSPSPRQALGPGASNQVAYLLLTVWIGLGVLMLLPGMQAHVASYSDWIYLYRSRHWAQHPLPYLHQAMEYPVLLGWGVWALTWVPGGETGFVLANGFLMWICAVGIYRNLLRIAPRHAIWWAATPLLIVLATQNWDLWGILPFIAAFVAYERQRWAWTGVWLAVGTAIKLFPVLAWPFMVYALWRRGERRAASRLTLAAATVWAAINLPTLLAAPTGWLWFWRFNAGRPLHGDLWTTFHLAGFLTTPQWNTATLALVLAVAGATLRAMSRGLGPRAATAIMLVAFFILNKVWSPQYMLWVFGMACVAEWPLWTLAVLSASGLLDWVNLYLMLPSPKLHRAAIALLTSWHSVYVWGVRLRYASLALAATGGQSVSAVPLMVRKRRQAPASPVGRETGGP